MNYTAKKLREAAEYIGDGETCSDTAIVTVREMFDVGRADTFGGDLGRVLVAIADELDKLQTKANEANNLRQQLESAEDKAERRKRHIGYLDTTLHDKNGLLERRGGTIARLTAENGELRKQVPSEREREILDMWPKFEDGKYVWFGDEVACRGKVCMLDDVKFVSDGTFHDATFLYVSNGLDVFEVPIAAVERLKRPVQSVLDADGVEIGVGDTVYEPNGKRGTVVRVHPQTGCVDLSQGDCDAYCMDAESLTHTRPDSWGRLAEDAAKHPCVYAEGVKGGKFSKCSECPWGNECDGSRAGEMMARDVIRRAKALAGTEVE